MKRSMMCVLALLVLAVPVVSAQEVQWLAHLSANDQFSSDIVFRNDASGETANVIVEFYDSDGLPAQATLTASGQQMTVSAIELALPALSSETVSIQSVSGGDNRSLQARILTNDGDLLAVEASFSRFDNGEKTAVVGVPVAPTGTIFRVNVNNAPDPVSGLNTLRGIGIANTDEEEDCTCVIALADNDGEAIGAALVTIPPRGKWLGIAGSLFPDSDLQGKGYLDALCGQRVAIQALSFEGVILSTVPVTVFDLP